MKYQANYRDLGQIMCWMKEELRDFTPFVLFGLWTRDYDCSLGVQHKKCTQNFVSYVVPMYNTRKDLKR